MSPQTSPASYVPLAWSKSAIASALLAAAGMASLLLGVGLFIGALAAILGHLGLHATTDPTGKQIKRGRRLAVLGVGGGYGAMILFPFLALIVAVSFPAVSQWRKQSASELEVERRTGAARLYVACEAFARANGDRYPDDWSQLSGAYLANIELNEILHPAGLEVTGDAFELVRHDRPVLSAIRDTVIVIQEIAPAKLSEIVVVYADGSVETLPNPDYEIP